MENKLKVGIGNDAFWPTVDGVCTVAKYYADIINRELGEAVIITPENPNKKDYMFPYEIYRYKSLFTFGEGYPVGWPFKEQFAKDVINYNFDILHSHCPVATSYFFRRVNRMKRIPTVLTYHTKFEYDIDTRVKSLAIRQKAYTMIGKDIKCADEVWVTSRGTADSLRIMGYEGDFVVMPNGCDLPKISATDEQKAIIHRKHNLPDGVPILIFAGRLMWYKNIRLIFDAVRILKSKNKDFRLLMLGIGPEEKQMKKYCAKIGIDDKIIFTGMINDRRELQLYYAASDLLVFPSLFDTNGLVVREAAASKTPSLLVKDSCAAEGIIDCETGFICEESAHSIAQSIERLIQNNDLMKRVGEKAQNDIYISWEESIHNAYDRYQVVIDKFNSKPKEPYIW
ncbi:MAG: glycosyltransferase [Eubacterium sp.]|nr:glycosyltransferase [Eubacterium sp.]